MNSASGWSCFRFGPFELDHASGDLFRDGHRVRLQEHPRQVLIALLERPGQIVTRDDLRERLWKSDTFVDFEHGLNTAVKKARQALGDSAESPEFIETVARRGYRFVARVEAVEPTDQDIASVPPAQPAVATGARPASTSPGPVVVRAALLAALVLVIVAAWMLQRRPAQPAAPLAASSARAQLAVMPLRVLSEAAADTAYLGIGIADAITTRLANTRQITVRPTSAVLPFRDTQADPVRTASTLRVQHLLLGSIQPMGDTFRINVQLVRADGVAVWGRRFDQPRAALPTLQDHLADQVVAALRVELSPPERARLHVRYTDNAAAYDLYLRGRALLVDYTEARMHEAIAFFEQALELDRNYALARAGIATACAWFSVRYAHDSGAAAWGKRAEDEARRALEQDGALADAHFAIAGAAGTTYGGFRWETVLERSATALALDPSLDLAHVARMRAYYHLGLFEEAREQAALARAINPSPNVELDRLQVVLLLFEGQITAAIEQATSLQSRTDAPAVRHYLGLARYYAGDAAGARETLSSITRGDRPDVRAQASLASVEAATGFRKEARARVATVTRSPDLDHHVAYSLGAALAQLGDLDDSVMWLERAADTGLPCYPWFERDTLLDPVRRHPRFERLIARLKEAHEVARRHPL